MDNSLEQVLLDFGINLAPVEAAGAAIKETLMDLNDLSIKVEDNAKKAVAGQKQELIQLEHIVDALLKESMGIIKTVGEEAKKSAILKTQTHEHEKQAQLQRVGTETAKQQAAIEAAKQATLRLETEELRKQEQAQKAETAEIQKQIALLRQKRMEDVHVGGGGGHGGGGHSLGGLRAGLGRAIFGGGPGGAIAAGILAGSGISLLLQNSAHAAEHFVEKLKEASLEAASFIKVEDQFRKLAIGAGEDADKMMAGLRHATEGEVDNLTLMKTALLALKSTSKISAEELEHAAGAAFKLAEAGGKQGVEGINALNRTLLTGMTRSLAMATGLNVAQLRLESLPPTMSKVERSAAQMHKVIEELTKAAKKLGETPDTLEDVENRLSAARKNLFTAFGAGFNDAVGTKRFIEWANEAARELNGLEGRVRSFGEQIGSAMAYATINAILFKDALVSIAELLTTITHLGDTQIEQTRYQSSFLEKLQAGLIESMAVLRTMVALTESVIKTMVDGMVVMGAAILIPAAVASGQMKLAQETWEVAKEASRNIMGGEGFTGRMDEINKAAEEAYTKLGQLAAGTYDRPRRGSIAPPDGGGEGLTEKDKAEMASLREKHLENLASLDQAHSKAQLQERQADIARLRELENVAYRAGEVDLEKHLETLRQLSVADNEAKLADIESDKAAKLQKLAVQRAKLTEDVKAGRIKPIIADLKRVLIDDQADQQAEEHQGKVIAQRRAFETDISRIEREAAQDRKAERQREIASELEQETTRLHSLQAINERRFQAGKESPDAYFKAQIEYTEALANAQIKAAQRVYDEIAAKSDKSRADLKAKVQKAIDEAKSSFILLEEGQVGKRLKALQGSYGAQQGAIETQLGYDQVEGGRAGGTSRTALLLAINENLARQREQLFDLLYRADKYSDQWYDIYGRIEKTYQSQVKYNLELQKSVSLLKPLAEGFGSIGKAIESNFHSKFAQNLGSVIQTAAKGLGETERLGAILTGTSAVKKDPKLLALEQEASDLFVSVRGSVDKVVPPFERLEAAAEKVVASFQKVSEQADEFAGIEPQTVDVDGKYQTVPYSSTSRRIGQDDKKRGPKEVVDEFVTRMGAAISILDNFSQSVINAKSAISGGIGGAIEGAGIGSLAGKIPKLGKMLGPWGEIGGAAVGAMVGVITGAKNAKVTADINRLNTSYKNLMDQFAQNTNNLQQTITQMQSLVQYAYQQQAKSKKGSAQYQQVIDQYNQQLQQLLNQQDQTVRKLEQQLAILRAPLGQQDQLGNLQQIVATYQQFAGAARSVTELADANEYLVLSMEKYSDSLAQQLATDNEQAINDALQLNELLYQRTEMMRQYSNQVQGILSQGILTRQPTRAQTIGQQIHQLDTQYQRQLETLNKDIGVAQFKVEAEGKVFDLATTRIGLETQLLVLQNNQTRLSVEQITALRSLVQQLQSGDFSSGAFGALLGLSQGVNSPFGSNQSITEVFETLVAKAFESRAAFGYANYRGQNI